MLEQVFSIVSLADLLGGQQEIFITSLCQQLFQILFECLSLQPTTDILLDGYRICSPLFIVECNEVSRFITSVQTLDQNTWTISFKDSLKSIDIHLQVELVLLSTPFMTIVWNMQLHEFI